MYLGNSFKSHWEPKEDEFADWLQELEPGITEIPLDFCFKLANVYTVGYDLLPWYREYFYDSEEKYVVTEYHLQWNKDRNPVIRLQLNRPKFDTEIIANGNHLDRVQKAEVKSGKSEDGSFYSNRWYL